MDVDTLTAKAVAWLGLATAPAATPDAAAAVDVSATVHELVTSGQLGRTTASGDWTADTTLGAVMLIARLVRRRNSISGVEQFTGTDAAIYTARTDPDVARLLRIDRYKSPRIG